MEERKIINSHSTYREGEHKKSGFGFSHEGVLVNIGGYGRQIEE